MISVYARYHAMLLTVNVSDVHPQFHNQKTPVLYRIEYVDVANAFTHNVHFTIYLSLSLIITAKNAINWPLCPHNYNWFGSRVYCLRVTYITASITVTSISLNINSMLACLCMPTLMPTKWGEGSSDIFLRFRLAVLVYITSTSSRVCKYKLVSSAGFLQRIINTKLWTHRDIEMILKTWGKFYLPLSKCFI